MDFNERIKNGLSQEVKSALGKLEEDEEKRDGSNKETGNTITGYRNAESRAHDLRDFAARVGAGSIGS